MDLRFITSVVYPWAASVAAYLEWKYCMKQGRKISGNFLSIWFKQKIVPFYNLNHSITDPYKNFCCVIYVSVLFDKIIISMEENFREHYCYMFLLFIKLINYCNNLFNNFPNDVCFCQKIRLLFYVLNCLRPKLDKVCLNVYVSSIIIFCRGFCRKQLNRKI